MFDKRKILAGDLDRLKAIVKEAKPHIEALTAALAVSRAATEALLPILNERYMIGFPANNNDAYAEGGAAAYLDVECLRPQLFELRRLFALQDCLAERAVRESSIPRQTLRAPVNGNGRKLKV